MQQNETILKKLLKSKVYIAVYSSCPQSNHFIHFSIKLSHFSRSLNHSFSDSFILTPQKPNSSFELNSTSFLSPIYRKGSKNNSIIEILRVIFSRGISTGREIFDPFSVSLVGLAVRQWSQRSRDKWLWALQRTLSMMWRKYRSWRLMAPDAFDVDHFSNVGRSISLERALCLRHTYVASLNCSLKNRDFDAIAGIWNRILWLLLFHIAAVFRAKLIIRERVFLSQPLDQYT